MISKLLLLELKTLKQLIKNKSNVNVNIVKNILQLDPTLNVEMITDNTEIGKYGEWLLGKLYKKYDLLSNEEKDIIKNDLLFYDYQIRSKRIPQEYDNIYKIKSIEELHNIVKKLQDNNNPLTQEPVTVAIGNHKFKTVFENPFELLKKLYYGDIKEGNTTKWLVFNPKTKEESIVAGHGSSWCTSRDDENNLWDDYIYEEITAWIFLLSSKYKIANPNEYNKLINEKLDKVCIIVERGECKNKSDDQFDLKKIPEIGRFIEDKIASYEIKLENHDILNYHEGINNILTGIKDKNNRLNKSIKLTKEELIEYLKNDKISPYEVFKRLKLSNIEIDEEIQAILLVAQNGWQIQHINNPSEEVQLLLVSNTGDLIQFIPNPSKKVQLLLVSQNGYLIEFIPNPSEEVQLLLVSKNGNLIKFIPNPSEEIQLLLVSKNGFLIMYIKNPNEEIQLLLVSQNGFLIKYINNPNEEIQLLLIKNNKYLYLDIKKPTPKLTLLYKQLMGIKESTQHILKLLDVN